MHPEDAPSRDDYAAKEMRKSKLPLEEQDKAIAQLTEMVSVLADRLQPVLTPTEPTDKESADRAVPAMSEHANTLNDNNYRIRRATNKISNLIERLEV